MKATGSLKYCPRCKKFLSISEYSIDNARSDGLKVYCKSCRKLSEKEYYYKDLDITRENARERQRIFRQNPENADKYRKYALKQYYDDPKGHIARRKEWRHSENGRKKMLLQLQRRRAAANSVNDNLNPNDISYLLDFQNNSCACCKSSFSVIPYTIDHIIPISLGGDTTLNNVQLLCRSCNSRKGNKTIFYRETFAFQGGLK